MVLGCATGEDLVAGSAGSAAGGPAGTGGTAGLGGSGGTAGTAGLGLPPAAGDRCKVAASDLDAPPDCVDRAPPDSFEPVVQWSWQGPPGYEGSAVMPLVANLTDDDDNGEIDLCDVPDIVVVAGIGRPEAFIHVLDGATGAEHLEFPIGVDATVTPALGDIDADGIPEIVSARGDGSIVAFEHDGVPKWQTAPGTWDSPSIGSVALADLDHDGQVEIVAGNTVLRHDGSVRWKAPDRSPMWSSTVAADLDGDGFLEVVMGSVAYRHDGSVYYVAADVKAGYPQVANLDADPMPEVVVTNEDGLNLIEHDGSMTYRGLQPTGDVTDQLQTWWRPATIHDFDGDGKAEYAMSSANHYSVYEADASIVWSAPVQDHSGIAAGTAFDFLGDGIAEAMYADEQTLHVFDGGGQAVLEVARSSTTLSEYPVVADVDDDGSAEIVVVSNQVYGEQTAPTVQVIRDAEDRWIPARRIWNQHTYHVTNVREDGTLPLNELPHYASLNTFRTQAQIGEHGVCEPPLVK
jgi:hypothetical protein